MMWKASYLPLCVAALGIALMGFPIVVQPLPILIWNASASVPIGFYRVVSGSPQRHDFVLVRPQQSIEVMADKRGYLPHGVPLIKRIAAMSGDAVCAMNKVVQINGDPVARQLNVDRAGRSLPQWHDCRTMGGDEVFLLTDAPDSFDSRYFGPVSKSQIMGRLEPLWTR